MQNKTLKLILTLFILLSVNLVMGAEEKIQVVVKKTDLVQDTKGGKPLVKKAPFSFLLNGMRQALTNELVKNEMDSDLFWKKIEEKEFDENSEINYFRPYFNRFNVVMEKPTATLKSPSTEIKANDPADPSVIPKKSDEVLSDQFQRATFSYEFDSDKVKSFFLETLGNDNDVSVKTFYIISDISISNEMNWMDVGVTRRENFSGVIVDSWKKWAETQFKNFPNVVVLDKDFTEKSEKLNSESVTLKWSSLIKKSEVFYDRKSARFEVNAQYVLMNTKSNQSLLAFDFPAQKQEIEISDTKELSSKLASLVYNLLNSQTVKIKSALELNRATSTLTNVDLKVTGKHGLFDITQINSMLAERFKSFGLTSEMKSYSMDGSIISIKSTMNEVALYEILSKEGGKLPINEQKILLFSPESKGFAIIAKEANN